MFGKYSLCICYESGLQPNVLFSIYTFGKQNESLLVINEHGQKMVFKKFIVCVFSVVIGLCGTCLCKKDVALPLLDDIKAPLVAHLDVSDLNQAITSYINLETERKVHEVLGEDLKRLVNDKTSELADLIDQKISSMKDEINGAINASITATIREIQKADQYRCLQNLAAGKSSSQSTSYNIFHAGSATNDNLNDFTHTQTERTPWLRVDLGDNYRIQEVEIFNRKDCCGFQLHDFDVKVGRTLHDMELCGHYIGQAGNGDRIIMKCGQHPVARHVQIQIVKGQSNVLHVAEILVWGTK